MATSHSHIISEIMVAASNSSLYSTEHESVAHHCQRAADMINDSLVDGGALSFTLIGGSLFANEEKLPDKDSYVMSFKKRLRRSGVERISFSQGITSQEIRRLVSSMSSHDEKPASSANIKVGVIEVRLGSGGRGAADIVDEQVQHLKEVHSSLARFGSLDTVGIEDIVAGLIAALKQESNILKALSPLKLYSEYTFTHVSNVSLLSMYQAESMGIKGDLLHEVGIAALLHDVGKVFVPKEILDKPSKLEPEEWDIMKKHTFYGAQYLSGLEDIPHLAVIAAYEHHLRYDGSGYPEPRRRDKRQHVISQMIALADFFDALRTERPYRKSMDVQIIVGIMEKGSGTEFNPDMVANFISILKNCGAFSPPGGNTPSAGAGA